MRNNPEARKKISIALTGRKRSPESIAKFVAKMKGHKISEETRKKLKEAQKGEKNHNWKGTYKDKLMRLSQRRIEKLERIAGRKKSEQCEICGAMGIIHFDHDHRTGKFRGWICRRCNLTLGYVKDNTELLKSMMDYLLK